MNPAAKERLAFEIQRLKELPPSLGKVTQADAEGFAFNVDVAESPALDTRALPARFAVTIPPTWPARAPQAVLVCAGSLQRDTYSALAIGKPVQCPLLDEDGWSRNYELAVLFHTLRDLFKVPNSPWDTPWQLQHAPWLPQPELVGASNSLSSDRHSSSSGGGGTCGLVLGHAGVQGRRRSMEDVVLLRQGLDLPVLQTASSSLFGVFDGHAGDSIARFAEHTVPAHLSALLGGPKVADGSSSSSSGNSGCALAGDLREALARSFLEVDARAVADASLRSSGAGCTACVACFNPANDALVLANLGDCRAVLALKENSSSNTSGSSSASSSHSGAGWCDLTFDCRADRPDEVARIVQRGGFVNLKRVNGSLAVSRALGDADFKTGPTGPLVSSCPEVTSAKLNAQRDEFVLLACDGLWDVMSSADAIAFVRERLKRDSSSSVSDEERELDEICEALAKHAVEVRRSTDNVSVVVAKIVRADRDGGKRGSAYKHPKGGAAVATAPPSAAALVAGTAGDAHASVPVVARAAGERRPALPEPIPRYSAVSRVPAALGGGSDLGRQDPAGMPTKAPGFTIPLDGSMNALGLHQPKAKQSSAGVIPKSKVLSLDTDEDLMDYLLDDANFG